MWRSAASGNRQANHVLLMCKQQNPVACCAILRISCLSSMAKGYVWSELLCVLQNYVRNLVNFDISIVGHLDNFDKMQSYLDQGDNVVCLANHQTEADPGAVLSICRPYSVAAPYT